MQHHVCSCRQLVLGVVCALVRVHENEQQNRRPSVPRLFLLGLGLGLGRLRYDTAVASVSWKGVHTLGASKLETRITRYQVLLPTPTPLY